MNEVVKRVKTSAKKINAEDIKSLVEAYNITQVVVTDAEGDDVVKLYANRCELFEDKIEFYQSGTLDGTNGIAIRYEDMTNATLKEDEEEGNYLILQFDLPDDQKLCLTFFNEWSADDLEGWHEVDLDNMMTFMDEALHGTNGYYLVSVNVSDSFALNMNIYGGNAFIDECDEDNLKLRVNADGTNYALTVFDDSCNEFQSKTTGDMRCFRIFPYGQPFTTVKLVYCKKPE
jgi:hypothetical protein